MDRKTWSDVVDAIARVCREAPQRKRRPKYSDALMLKLFIWAAYHEHKREWAVERTSFGRVFRPRRLPSYSQFCKRVNEARFEMLLDQVTEKLGVQIPRGELLVVDGKPLEVGNFSQDPDAKNGYGAGGFARGYKLHAIVGEHGQVLKYEVVAMNHHEVPIAAEHLIDAVADGDLVLGDGNYDGRRLYEGVEKRGGQLITPLRGGVPEKMTNPQPNGRAEVIRMLCDDPKLFELLYKQRVGVERAFSVLVTAMGLQLHLPAWVRRLHRVRRWVAAKLALFHARIIGRLAA